ncbi:hypothetical protein [Vibrio harveyi]|uniref:hypothetical protein n=1 Tax=Vibrio harveyi TaxID=669 RepID=UPI003CE6CA6D
MNKCIDGSFDLPELKQFLSEVPSVAASAYVFDESTYVKATISELLSPDSHVDISITNVDPHINDKVRTPFDLIIISKEFFITIKGSNVQANTGSNEARLYLEEIVKKLKSLYNFN